MHLESVYVNLTQRRAKNDRHQEFIKEPGMPFIHRKYSGIKSRIKSSPKDIHEASVLILSTALRHEIERIRPLRTSHSAVDISQSTTKISVS
jgi:hypothetical protein